MKTTIYIDVLIITNMIINYFILKIISCIAEISTDQKRIILSSLIGSLFSFTIFLNIPNSLALILKIFSVLFSSFIAFGYKSKLYFTKCVLYSVTVYFIFTGAVIYLFQNNRMLYSNNFNLYLNINPVTLVFCIIFIYIIVYIADIVFYRQSKNLLYDIEIHIEDKRIKGKALYDTGFRVKDILTHKSLILCDYNFISEILSQDIKDNLNNFYINGEITDKRIKTVFYSDVSKEGILLGIIPDKVICKNNEIKNTMLVITKAKIEGEINFLIGKEIFNTIKE